MDYAAQGFYHDPNLGVILIRQPDTRSRRRPYGCRVGFSHLIFREW
jgi:hypothetical protein